MSVKSILKRSLERLPVVGRIIRDYNLLHANACFPPGHFYSPIIDKQDILSNKKYIWSECAAIDLPGLNLNPDGQQTLLADLLGYLHELPFEDDNSGKNRYYFNNPYFSYTDAVFLYALIRKLKPKRIIEIGSGFSSAVMLDTNEMFFNNSIRLTFIEPFPERLRMLMRPSDALCSEVVVEKIQNVDTGIFRELSPGDMLFVDSSHVSKTGSDVNHILFRIMPMLQRGVFIHFHDIFYPFEYPEKWVLGGRNWNEDYLLRAFMSYNDSFQIRLFTDFLHQHHPGSMELMDKENKNRGASLWLEKIK